MFSFAGLWRRWTGSVKKDGPVVEIDTYSFMTTAPNSATSSINHERSPVLLTSAAEQELWINGSAADALELVRPIDGSLIRIVQEGFEKLDLLGAEPPSPISSGRLL